jgi:hypothetical protein
MCQCAPEAGPASCVAGDGFDTGFNVHCVYASCNSTDENEPCTLPDGAPGTCCAGSCVALLQPAFLGMMPGYVSDPNNCGGCGNMCLPGTTCPKGVCITPCGPTDCPAGRVCSYISQSCEPIIDCPSEPDGTPCRPTVGGPGICCGGACISPTDDSNCGGCGIVCCPGTNCGPTFDVKGTSACL